jgi:hypothetical protein
MESNNPAGMSLCDDCNSWYLVPGRCNCFAPGGKRYVATPPTTTAPSIYATGMWQCHLCRAWVPVTSYYHLCQPSWTFCNPTSVTTLGTSSVPTTAPKPPEDPPARGENYD